MNSDERPLTTRDVADLLNVSVKTIYKLVGQKKLPFYKPNNKFLYFKKSEIMDFVFASLS